MSRFPDPMLSELLWVSTRFLEAVRRANKRRTLKPIEDTATKAIGKAFVAQGKAFAGKLAEISGQFPMARVRATLQEAVSESDWGPLWEWAAKQGADLLEQAIRAAALDAMTEGANGAALDLAGIDAGYSFDLLDPRVIAYLQEHGAALVRAVNDTTKAEIRTLITTGLDNGQSYGDIARAITARFQEFAAGKPQQHIDSRSHLVAVQEAGQAYEFANFTATGELQTRLGAMEKSWSTMNDTRVSDICRGNADAGWIPLDEPFPSGHLHPLGHVACRCDLLTRVKEG